MKTQLFALFCLFSAVSFAEEQFDSDKWNSCYQKAEEQAKEELGNEFVMNRSDWESGKGVCFFVGGGPFMNLQSERWTQGYYMKFNPEGSLVKVALWKDFPELVKFYNRRMELAKLFQEEYAKSLGMTVEECEKKKENNQNPPSGGGLKPSNRLLGLRGMIAQRKEREEKRKVEQEAEKKRQEEERARMREELLPKIEQFVGYKFGQAPIQGIAVETNLVRRGFQGLQDTTEMTQKIVLQNPYRYMRNAKLTYRHNKLCEVELYVDFGGEYSDEAIGQESEAVRKDLSEKLGLRENELAFAVGRYGVHVDIRRWKKELKVAFTDRQTIEEFDAAEQEAMRKQGRALPTIEDWKKEETLKEEERAREESVRLAQQKEQEEKLLAQRKAREEKRKAEREDEKKRQEEEQAKMREELAALSEEVRQAREERELSKSESSAELRKKVEQFTGYKLGTPIIEGNGTKIRSSWRQDGIKEQVFETKLAKPCRYMKDVRLTYWNNRLWHIAMFAKFDKEYSDESIGEELEEIKKEIVSKFELENQNTMRGTGSMKGCLAGWSGERLWINMVNKDKELTLWFVDYKIKEDVESVVEEAKRKRGRKLPKFEEAK